MSKYPTQLWDDKFAKEDIWEFKTNPWQFQRFNDVVYCQRHLKPKNILDLGCMEGEFTVYLPTKQEIITGVDMSEVALTRARRKLPRAKFFVYDIEGKPLEEKYDLIICMETLYYLLDTELAKENIISSINSNGYLLLEHVLGSVHNKDKRKIADVYHETYLKDNRLKLELSFRRFGINDSQSYEILLFKKV